MPFVSETPSEKQKQTIQAAARYYQPNPQPKTRYS
jgi:hypothetical protein